MTGERDLAASAECCAVDRGDDRLFVLLDRGGNLRQYRLGHRRAEFADVGPADEGFSCAGDDDPGDVF